MWSLIVTTHYPFTLSLIVTRESLKAEAVGLTWIEWWEERTEDDVARDDAEQELMYRDAYDDDSIDINDDLSDDTDEFTFWSSSFKSNGVIRDSRLFAVVCLY